jgi:ribose 5-phosphate isomerase B
MKIMIACDHAGLELKEKLVRHLKELGLEVNDIGTHDTSPVDYPQYAAQVARVCMTANRFHGVRAVQVSEPFFAKMSRRHNDSNILCLGGRFLGEALAFEITDVWLRESFEGGRHQKRVDLIDGLAGKV